MRPKVAALACVIGALLIGVAFSLGRFLMIDPDVMTAFMLALVPPGVFALLEGLLSFWRDARMRALLRAEKP